MMFRSHSMVAFATPHRIASNHVIRVRIDNCKDIVILEIHINFAQNRVVLGHTCFTAEVQGLWNFVLRHIDDGLRLSSFIGYIELVKGSGIGASIWLALGLELLDDLHLLHVDDTYRVVTSIGG